MEVSYVIYGAVALFSLLCYYLIGKQRSGGGAGKTPPEAGGAWPFVGHLHLIRGGGGGLPHVDLGNLADKHGPIFGIRVGVHRVAVVSGRDLVKELFTTNDAAVTARPHIRAGKHMAYDSAMFGFTSNAAYWREIRKLAASELLSPRRIELQRGVRAAETTRFVNELYKLVCDGGGRAVVDMKKWFGELTLNVVLMMGGGKWFAGGGVVGGRCRQVMRDLFHYSAAFVAADALPYVGWADVGGVEKRMREVAKEMDEVVGEWLEEHRKREYSGEDKARDFMDVMLSAVKGWDFKCEYDVDTIIKATCGNLIAGGNDSTSIVLIWALSLLLNNRHVLKKAQEELDKYVGKDRRVNESDINNLLYLQAITKETLRLYPPAPLSGTRRLIQDCKVGGYHIPKETWLMVNLYKLHRDPRMWPNPLEFKPERFLNGDKNVDVKGQDFELIPFGAGRRICPGINLGLQMLHLMLASLLQAFDLLTISNEEIDMTESAGLTNFKATPLDVLVSPRLSPNLYN